MEDGLEEQSEDGYLLVRIHVPELNNHKCLQFPKDQLVWDVKQQCLASLPKELKESFNYGLFCPPVNGKAGKFLDEERRLGDYPFNGPVGYLELKYKRRVYKMLNLDEKQLKALHTRANLRRFLEYVANGQVEKINKMCTKGLDPNFHCPESGVPFREPPRYNPRRRSKILPPLPNPPSPSPSNRSLPPFSSASSEASSSSHKASSTSAEDSASYVTDKSLGDTSDIISDSSGVGTSNSDTTASVNLPGTTVVCVENYSSTQPGHLRISQGDILEVTGATDCGLLEGVLRGETGLFPPECVQEVRLRQNLVPPPPPVTSSLQRRNSRVIGRRESSTSVKHFATAPRHKKQLPAEPRTVVLHRARRGFGFVLRGAKATSPLMELTPSQRCPGLQYLDDVDKGGVIDLAGLKKGDYLLKINGEDVSAASHEHVVDLIRSSGDLVSMTVVSLGSLPSSKSAAALGGQPAEPGQPTPRQYATLPRKHTNNVPTLGQYSATAHDFN
ncbi:hypothetical protein LSTR_LSTR006912, partial [Laodelphax striatellus]